jgi:hypothetical protein
VSVLVPALFLAAARAQAPVEAMVAPARQPDVEPAPAPARADVVAVGLLQARGITTNIVTTNPFLDGQVIGALGGTNGATVLPPAGLDLDGDGAPDSDLVGSRYVEQRGSVFLDWAPKALDHRVGLLAAFEIDYLWGDQSYGTNGNTGGGLGGDQVNLQTRRLAASLRPRAGAGHDVEVVAGLQFVGDGVYNPTRARPDDLFRAGAGLAVIGTEAAGLAVYGRLHDRQGDRLRYRAGAFSMVENGVGIRDDAALFVADLAWAPAWQTLVGLHAWHILDATDGRAGTLGVGPASALSGLQGGPKLDFRPAPDATAPDVQADITWLGVDAGFNHALAAGPFGIRGFAGAMVGTIYVRDQGDVALRGYLIDVEARHRWARGSGSVLRAEVLTTGRDGTGRDAYTGVITANSYGIVGAVWGSHGTLLLFTDPLVVNRSTPLVPDVANGGRGLRAATAGAGWDIIPEKLTLQANAAHARDGYDAPIGSELNARLLGHPFFGTTVGLGAATVRGTAFDTAPWMAMVHLESLLF